MVVRMIDGSLQKPRLLLTREGGKDIGAEAVLVPELAIGEGTTEEIMDEAELRLCLAKWSRVQQFNIFKYSSN